MIEKAKMIVAALRTDCAEQSACADCPLRAWCRTDEVLLNKDTADLIESLAAELEQVKRERDAAVDDLSAHRHCDDCGLYELQGVRCMQCRRYTERPYWQWRGVKED